MGECSNANSLAQTQASEFAEPLVHDAASVVPHSFQRQYDAGRVVYEFREGSILF